jgi:hypothetical protein
MKRKVINLLPWIIALIQGIIGFVISFKFGFLKTFLCGIVLCIITTVVLWLVIKIGKVDVESVRQPMALYFISNCIVVFIFCYIDNDQYSIFDSLISTLFYELLFNFVPAMLLYSTEGGGEPITSNSSSSSKCKYGIESHDICDKYGNVIAKSTTYSDGASGIDKTYVTDRLGNTIAESTSIDGYKKTKINTSGRY